jgi:hypothetical protein
MSRDIKYIGMDVHKEAIVIAVHDGGGKLVMECIETKASSIHGRAATAIRIPVVLCGAPGVKIKILSTKKKEPGCKPRSRSHGEEWRSVFA